MSTHSRNRPITAWHARKTSSAVLNDWLFDEHSLTQRLSRLCKVGFVVQPLNEGWQQLSADECSTLNLAPDSTGWVREVFLCDGMQPWVFARSVAGKAQLLEANFDLSQLGNRSLGQLLFNQPAFSRGPLQICQLPIAQLPVIAQQPSAGQQQVWARRSCFKKESLGVLVAEVFLPKFWQDSDLTLFS